MDPALLAVLGTLGGVLLGTVSTHLADRWRFKREKTWERNNLLRAKLEMIGQLAERLRFSYSQGTKRRVFRATSAPVTEEKPVTAPLPLDRLKMMVAFYAPQLQSSIECFEELRKAYSKTIVELPAGWTQGAPGTKEVILRLLSAQDSIDAWTRDFHNQLGKQARELLTLE